VNAQALGAAGRAAGVKFVIEALQSLRPVPVSICPSRQQLLTRMGERP
jgi:hypothetical protein